MLELETAERIIILHRQNKSCTEISLDLDLGDSTVGRYLTFLDIHGEHEFKKFYVDGQRPSVSFYQYACIVEYMNDEGCSADKAAAIFKANRHKLQKLFAKRMNSKEPLTPEAVAAVPPESYLRFQEQTHIATGTAPKGRTFLSVTGRASECNQVPSRDKCVVESVDYNKLLEQANNSPEQEPLPPHIIGRSKAHAKEGRPKKKMRNKAVTQANKAQKALEERYKQITSGEEQSSDKANSNLNQQKDHQQRRPKALDARRPHPASEFFEKNGNVGKSSLFDPFSEGFDKLPLDIQNRSLKRFCADQCEVVACLKKSLTFNINKDNSLGLEEVNRIKCGYARMLKEDPANFKQKNICDALDLSKDVYYYDLQNEHLDKYVKVKEMMLEIQQKCGFIFGKKRMKERLLEKGITLSVPLVRKLMLEANATPIKTTVRKYNSYKKNACVNVLPNLVHREFVPKKPFKLIVTDVTMFNIKGTKVFLAIYVDLFCNLILAYSISLDDSVEASIKPLKQVLAQLPEPEDDNFEPVIFHSDQGFQYQNDRYQQTLRDVPNVKQSMSRVGNCYDNGACESVFGRIKEEVFNLSYRYESVAEFTASLSTYLHFYNNERPQARLEYKSPIRYLQDYHRSKRKEQATSLVANKTD